MIGAGGVATVAAFKINQNADVFTDFMIASRRKEKCDKIVKAIGNPNIKTAQVDADDVEQLKALGDDVVMETEEGWTHEVTCIESYTTRRLDWVFAHRRNTVSGILTTTDGWGDKVVSRMYFTTDGKRVDAPSASHIYVVKEVLQNGEVTTRKSIF